MPEATKTRVELEFTPPDENAPGYLARMDKVYRFAEKTAPTPAEIREMVDFLLPFVTAPADPAAAREVMMNHVTRKQFLEMLRAVIRSDGDSLVPFGSEDS